VYGEGDKAVFDRDWFGFVKAKVASLFKLGLLLGLLLAGLLLLIAVSLYVS